MHTSLFPARSVFRKKQTYPFISLLTNTVILGQSLTQYDKTVSS
jgi:hypothetical protein